MHITIHAINEQLIRSRPYYHVSMAHGLIQQGSNMISALLFACDI